MSSTKCRPFSGCQFAEYWYGFVIRDYVQMNNSLRTLLNKGGFMGELLFGVIMGLLRLYLHPMKYANIDKHELPSQRIYQG